MIKKLLLLTMAISLASLLSACSQDGPEALVEEGATGSSLASKIPDDGGTTNAQQAATTEPLVKCPTQSETYKYIDWFNPSREYSGTDLIIDQSAVNTLIKGIRTTQNGADESKVLSAKYKDEIEFRTEKTGLLIKFLKKNNKEIGMDIGRFTDLQVGEDLKTPIVIASTTDGLAMALISDVLKMETNDDVIKGFKLFKGAGAVKSIILKISKDNTIPTTADSKTTGLSISINAAPSGQTIAKNSSDAMTDYIYFLTLKWVGRIKPESLNCGCVEVIYKSEDKNWIFSRMMFEGNNLKIGQNLLTPNDSGNAPTLTPKTVLIDLTTGKVSEE